MKRSGISFALLVLFGLSLAFSSNRAAGGARYRVFLGGNAVGFQTTAVARDGERRFEFEFHDRGRGPKLSTRLRLGNDGTPVSVETDGNDYLKNPVAERFSLADGRAAWKNRSESGERPLAQSAFYVSLDGVPEETGLLARALLRAPSHKLALLPEGEAGIVRVTERRIRAGGKGRSVVLYEISGLDFEPTPVWLDRDGSFFAVASAWFAVVREGWEDALPALLESQRAAEHVRSRELARSASRRPDHPVVFRAARLFDAEAAASRPKTTVVVSDDRIVSVGPDDAVMVPEGSEVIDARGKTLLPGLWDMHVHLSDQDGPLDIACGVTSVRDLGNDIEKVLELRRSWAEGEAVGPRLIPAGIIDGPGPYAGPTKVLVGTDKQAREAVARYASLGYPQIKIYSSVRPDLVPSIIAEAHERGLRVSGHVPNGMTAEEFVRAGADELQHINFLFLNFWPDVGDTRTPVRFTAVAENAADLDLDSEPVRRFVELLKERGTVVDPTVAIFENMFTARPGSVSPSYAAIAGRLPPQVRRGFLSGGLPAAEGKQDRYRSSFRAMLALVRKLHDAGIPIVAGTDGLAGFTLHRELELYAEAGIPAREVLQLATLGAARVMKRDAELGSIAVGKKADLVLVDGDPAARISEVRRVVMVVGNGLLYDPAILSRALGISTDRAGAPPSAFPRQAAGP